MPSVDIAKREVQKFRDQVPYTDQEINVAYAMAQAKFTKMTFDSDMAFGAFVAGLITGNRLNAAAAAKKTTP